MSQPSHELVHRLIEAWNAHSVDGLLGLYAPDYEEHDVAQAQPQRGLDGVRHTMTRYLQAFPDLSLTADQVIVEGMQVALAWTLSGTHRGTLMHIPASGRAVQVRGVSLLTVDDDGRIKQAQRIWDLAGLLRTIGLLPEL